MKVIWDPLKAKSNFHKHKVRFSDAESVLFDPLALTREDDDADGEQRFVSVGMNATRQILTVVYAYRDDDKIRVISARVATPKERRCYEKGI